MQSMVQGELGTHASFAPLMFIGGAAGPAARGVTHFGGFAGSVNAGTGFLKKWHFFFAPNFRKPWENLPSPADPGSAIDVVAGNGLKMHRPVESIAGNLMCEHPLHGNKATKRIKAKLIALRNPPIDPSESAAVALEWVHGCVKRASIDSSQPGGRRSVSVRMNPDLVRGNLARR